MCGVSGDRCLGFSVVRWLFGGSMVGLLAVLFVPLLSLLAMPDHCRIVRNTCQQRLYLLSQIIYIYIYIYSFM